jgi:hypothetical protein
MPIATIWRRLTGRSRKRVSFFDSQEIMRKAVLKPGVAVDLSHFTLEQLHQIAEHEGTGPRGLAAIAEIEARIERKKRES